MLYKTGEAGVLIDEQTFLPLGVISYNADTNEIKIMPNTEYEEVSKKQIYVEDIKCPIGNHFPTQFSRYIICNLYTYNYKGDKIKNQMMLDYIWVAEIFKSEYDIKSLTVYNQLKECYYGYMEFYFLLEKDIFPVIYNLGTAENILQTLYDVYNNEYKDKYGENLFTYNGVDELIKFLYDTLGITVKEKTIHIVEETSWQSAKEKFL